MEEIEQKCIKCRKIVGKIETLIPNDTFNVDILCLDCARKVMEQNIIDNKKLDDWHQTEVIHCPDKTGKEYIYIDEIKKALNAEILLDIDCWKLSRRQFAIKVIKEIEKILGLKGE